MPSNSTKGLAGRAYNHTQTEERQSRSVITILVLKGESRDTAPLRYPSFLPLLLSTPLLPGRMIQ
ncbi:MAG: hypothetical protein DBX00_11290 [Verrucomicrobia bacterium]|nr:MAG: hypothetical protein DBX00_11290 [Verrucomicrobiota bacterium]